MRSVVVVVVVTTTVEDVVQRQETAVVLVMLFRRLSAVESLRSFSNSAVIYRSVSAFRRRSIAAYQRVAGVDGTVDAVAAGYPGLSPRRPARAGLCRGCVGPATSTPADAVVVVVVGCTQRKTPGVAPGCRSWCVEVVMRHWLWGVTMVGGLIQGRWRGHRYSSADYQMEHMPHCVHDILSVSYPSFSHEDDRGWRGV